MRGRLLMLLFATGCYQPSVAPGQPCAENGACPEGQECRSGRCEASGGGDADGLDAVSDACASTCSGNDIVGCGAPVTCTTGCNSLGGAHCAVLVPSNGLSATMLTGATADVAGDWNFYDDGEIRKGNITLRPSGPGLQAGIGFQVVNNMAVYTAHSFRADAGVALEGSPGSYPLVLFAATTIEIAGEVDVGASFEAGGPGASSSNTSTVTGGCRGRAGRNIAATYADGGGGGGGATAGSDGGPSNMGTSTGAGGTVCTATPSTVPLRGGNGGGAGGASSTNHGGGGGGGLALVAMESITISGVVTAPGAGGASDNSNGGGGGGGGGAILLEAPAVTITSAGAVTANGGSGGAPASGDGQPGSKTSSTPVLGGSYICPVVGGTFRGGSGGTRTASPTAGQTCSYNDGLGVDGSRGGGGGGAVGKIEIKALVTTTTGATLSPTPATSMATVE